MQQQSLMKWKLPDSIKDIELFGPQIVGLLYRKNSLLFQLVEQEIAAALCLGPRSAGRQGGGTGEQGEFRCVVFFGH